MKTRAGSATKTTRPSLRSPSNPAGSHPGPGQGPGPSPSPCKKRQKVLSTDDSADSPHPVGAGHAPAAPLAEIVPSELSVESGFSQSTFIEKMENFSMAGKYSQSSYDGEFMCSEDTRSGWSVMSSTIRPRLNFNSQASQGSGYSTETIPADVSRDEFDVFGGGEVSMLVPPYGQGSNSSAHVAKHDQTRPEDRDKHIFKEPMDSMSVGSFSAPASTGALKPVQNPFLPPVERRPQLFGAPPRDRSTFDSKFDREFTVGSGAFAEVIVARNRLEGTIYAVKRVRAVITGERMQRRILHEVYALSVLRGCPHIVQYFDSWVDSANLWICTELCLKETLMSFLTYGKILAAGPSFFDQLGANLGDAAATPRLATLSFDEYEASQSSGVPAAGISLSQLKQMQNAAAGGPYSLHRNLSTTSTGGPGFEAPAPGGYAVSEELAWVVIESIGSALAFIHANGIAHLDIKPGNIFIGVSSYFELESLYGRLRNVSEYTRDHYEHLANLEPKLVSGKWKLKLGDFGNCCALDSWAKSKEEGDTRYCADELLFSENPDLAAADVFSLGVTAYELCTGELLPGSQENSRDWKDIRSGKLKQFDRIRRSMSSGGSTGLSISVSEAKRSMSVDTDPVIGSSSGLSPSLMSCIEKMTSPAEASTRPTAASLRRAENW